MAKLHRAVQRLQRPLELIAARVDAMHLQPVLRGFAALPIRHGDGHMHLIQRRDGRAARANDVLRHAVDRSLEGYLAATLGHDSTRILVDIQPSAARQQRRLVVVHRVPRVDVRRKHIEARERIRHPREQLGQPLRAMAAYLKTSHLHRVRRGYLELVRARTQRIRHLALRPPMIRYDLQRRAKRRKVQVDRLETIRLQPPNVPPNGILYQPLHTVPREGRRIALHRTAYQQYRRAHGGLPSDVKGLLGLGLHRPGAGDAEARLDESGYQRVPSAGGLVREHDGHDAVVLDDAAALDEDLPHLGVVIVGGQIARGLVAGYCPITKARRTGDGLVYLVRQVWLTKVGIDVANGALQPNVEEVGELRVVDVVVIGRVEHDGVHTARRNVQILRETESDLGRRSDVVVNGGSAVSREKCALVLRGGRIAICKLGMAGHRRQFFDALVNAVQSPIQPKTFNGHRHLSI